MQLEHLKCRGEDRRKEIIQEYDIEIITYTCLLNGRIKESDAGDIITNEYYEFLCTSKMNSTQKIIVCGKHAGKSLIELAGLEPIKKFNPLVNINENGNGGGGHNGENEKKEKWNEISLELYNAINILGLYWDVTLTGVLFNIKKDLEKYKSNKPFLKRIIKVNKCISKDKNKLTISQMLNKLREYDENIRQYSFEKINQILAENNIESYF